MKNRLESSGLDIFTVLMYRTGSERELRQTHSYLLGVFTSEELAIFQSQKEMLRRNGKYVAWLVTGVLNDSSSSTSHGRWVEYQYSDELIENLKDWND